MYSYPNGFTLTVDGVDGARNPAVMGVGVPSSIPCGDGCFSLIRIFDLVTLITPVDSTGACLLANACGPGLIFDLVTRCGGVSIISKSLSSSFSSSVSIFSIAVSAAGGYINCTQQFQHYILAVLVPQFITETVSQVFRT
jgi:hypothetical protein